MACICQCLSKSDFESHCVSHVSHTCEWLSADEMFTSAFSSYSSVADPAFDTDSTSDVVLLETGTPDEAGIDFKYTKSTASSTLFICVTYYVRIRDCPKIPVKLRLKQTAKIMNFFC